MLTSAMPARVTMQVVPCSFLLPDASRKEKYIDGYSDGHVGFYWSSSLCELSSAYEFDIYPTNYVEWQERVLRYYGQSVRAVFTE